MIPTVPRLPGGLDVPDPSAGPALPSSLHDRTEGPPDAGAAAAA
ncbi:MAG TPA: hypothetical protein VHI93_08770 [Candidatus Thermoplasmatota archaeon]|nr:hypothetical protein [Candidatus Thermoplasmatota archaeon]